MQEMIWYRYFAFSLFTVLTFLSCVRSSHFSPVNVTSADIAIKGYDPVAYFTDHMPVKGSADYEYIWNKAKWRFATAEHLALFKTEPEKYAPKYGGYCAYAVSKGKIVDIDPEAWTVFEGRLYLNVSKDIRSLWEKDKEDYIRKADENWPRMLRERSASK
jgi:YHS domain-containing protein